MRELEVACSELRGPVLDILDVEEDTPGMVIPRMAPGKGSEYPPGEETVSSLAREAGLLYEGMVDSDWAYWLC